MALIKKSVCPSSDLNEDDDHEDVVIRRMASVQPSVRRLSNYRECLAVLGFPVTTSPTDVSKIFILVIFIRLIVINVKYPLKIPSLYIVLNLILQQDNPFVNNFF